MISAADTIMASRGLNLTKYISNSPNVLEEVPSEKRAKTSSIEFDHSITRALGIKWNLMDDCFLYTVKVESTLIQYMKRQILKKTASVYDPLGFLTPFTLITKIIIQDLWRLKIRWDDEVDKKKQGKMETMARRIVVDIFLDMHTLSLNIQLLHNFQLHLFCEASEKTFASAAYIRIEEENNNARCHLLMAKSRVAPLKSITLPRLELQGAVMAVRMKETLIMELDLNFQDTFFWTDSTLNLKCINNEDKKVQSVFWKQDL